jgi:diadenosine tetraphosphatase ApaH/serine/threonine PP2A family protein phosphatase
MAAIALLGDIHSNQQALEACLDHARRRGVDGFAFLGDYVGYGAAPQAVLNIIMELVAAGAPAVRGNHDDMSANFDKDMNPSAASAANWTRHQLNDEHHAFLENLPLTATLPGADDVLLVHGGADQPEKWHYVTNSDTARRSLDACSARVVICGHVHTPAIYGAATGRMAKHTPVDGIPIPLMASRRWHVVLGSVGQPRDSNPAASYSIYDTVRHEITFQRVPYDVTKASAAIREAGLPVGLADRLFVGR